jgi:hypothetical protein
MRPGTGGQISRSDASIEALERQFNNARNGSQEQIRAGVALMRARRAANQPRNANGQFV